MLLLLSIIALSGTALCLPIGVINVIQNNYIIGYALVAWSLMSLPLYKSIIRLPAKIKSFTLIELVAVITVLSILMTIVAGIAGTDHAKTDSIVIKGELSLLQTESFTKKELIQFVPDPDKYVSEITLSSPLYFKTGEPVDDEGNALIGFYVSVHDSKTEPIKIYVKPFTGRITFY